MTPILLLIAHVDVRERGYTSNEQSWNTKKSINFKEADILPNACETMNTGSSIIVIIHCTGALFLKTNKKIMPPPFGLPSPLLLKTQHRKELPSACLDILLTPSEKP